MKEIIFTEHAPKAIGPYSQATATETLVFTSGQLGVDMGHRQTGGKRGKSGALRHEEPGRAAGRKGPWL